MSIESGRFAGRVAVVTGAASGIGAATVEGLLAGGARVVGGDINPDTDRDNYTAVRCDVTKESDVEALVRVAVENHGRLDLAFNVAGAARNAPIVDQAEEDWDFTVDLVLKGIFLSVKHEARAMTAGGAIVNVSSLNAHVPMHGGAAYASGKAGAEMLTKNAALELGDRGIRVNAVLPGLVETPLTTGLTTSAALAEDWKSVIVMGRPGRPAEIAAAMLFLASDEASYITGTSLVVDGGWEITGYPDLRKLQG